ncbi:MAG: YlbF family regulator [Clostridia bacterium]|nr:YlbF family regulator [Clostridia bacterium]
MSKIIELAHALGEEIAASAEMKRLEETKIAFSADDALQAKMREYEADQLALGQEFSKDPGEADQRAIADIRARMQELSAEITANSNYAAFAEAQKAVNAIMQSVNEEIKFCITGERPTECTHDCSTCKGCH